MQLSTPTSHEKRGEEAIQDWIVPISSQIPKVKENKENKNNLGPGKKQTCPHNKEWINLKTSLALTR